MTTSNAPLLIWGTGGHAISVLETATAAGETSISFCQERPDSEQFGGFPLVPARDVYPMLGNYRVVVAIGDNYAREQVVSTLIAQQPELAFATLIHPSAIVASSATLGSGSVILQGAVVGAEATIDEHCIMNTRSALDHESHMSRFASLAPGVTTGGNVYVGAGTAIGIGACIRHGIHIGRDSVVGSASYVHHDLPDNVVAYGTPARVIRHRQSGDPYLS